MSKYLIGAAAAAMVFGSTGAFAQDLPLCGTGALTGAAWTTQTVPTGVDSTSCYHGGSGNEVDCDDPGNHVLVETTSGSYQIREHQSNPNQNCLIANSEVEGSCSIDRTMGVGGTDFGYCD